MLLTPEQMQDARLRREADLYELHTIVGQTVSNQATLTDSMTKLAGTMNELAGTVSELATKHDALTLKVDALTETVDRMASKVDVLATTVDRFIRAQGDGNNRPGTPSH